MKIRKEIISFFLFLLFSILLIGCKKVTSKTAGTYYLKTANSIIEDSYIKVFENNTAEIYNVKIDGNTKNLKNCKLDIQKKGKLIIIFHNREHMGNASFDGKIIRVGNLVFAKK